MVPDHGISKIVIQAIRRKPFNLWPSAVRIVDHHRLGRASDISGKQSVAFSFFKKKDTDFDSRLHPPRSVVTPKPPAAEPPAPEAPPFGQTQDSYSGIEVSSGGSQLSAAEEEAAIMHANGSGRAAIPILQTAIQEIRGQRRLETWLMLFELYQQQNDRAAYENLGLEFVMEFERTPPIWSERKRVQNQPTATAGNTHTFGAQLTAATLDRELAPLRAVTTRLNPPRLDFSRVKEIDSMAAAEILALWHLSRKVATPRQILGGASFAKLLAGKIETGRRVPSEAPFWLLLIEVHQAMGLHEAFDNLAIEYAITFEVSPPSWDDRLAPKIEAAAPTVADSSPSAPPRECLVLQGEITSQHPQGLAEIRNYAQQGGYEIVLDFECVDRVDFESAGQFLNLFMELLQQGHSVHIIRVNELVLALLRLMGISELVTIERRKA